jgi:hypothetical protein
MTLYTVVSGVLLEWSASWPGSCGPLGVILLTN